MHDEGFTKLFSTIITSTIWQEDAETCKIWVTLLALANRYGEVSATIPGIARLTNIAIEKVEWALARFQQPDKYSRSQKFEGRRIQAIDGGYLLLNYSVYREKTRKDAEYYRKYREDRRNQMQPPATESNEIHPIAKAEAEADINITNFDIFRRQYPGKKRGLSFEIADFQRKHKNWKEITPLLLPALKRQIENRGILKTQNAFVPEWKNLKTWLNQGCWTEEINVTEQNGRNQRQSGSRPSINEQDFDAGIPTQAGPG